MRGEFMLDRGSVGPVARLSWALLLACSCGTNEESSKRADASAQATHDDAGAEQPGTVRRDAGAPSASSDAAVAAADASAPERDAQVPPPAPRLVLAYTGSGAQRGANANAGKLNIGHQFRVTQDGISLHELGVWDEGANGLHAPHTVTLFSLDALGNQAHATPVEGGSVVVPEGTAAPLSGGFRFAKLAVPLTLAQGNYAVIAYGLDADDPYGDGGNLPLSGTGIEHAAFVPYQFVGDASPAFPKGGDENSLCSASFRYESSRSPVLTILPLGDSITYGVGGTNAGYRSALRELLTQADVTFQFVGLAHDNPGMLPADQQHHEGHPGWVITSGTSGRDGLTDHLPTWLGPTGVTPDAVLLMVGTNDVNINYELDTAKQRLDALVSMIADQHTGLAPEARLFVAQIVPIVDANNDVPDNTKDPRATAYNQVVAEVVSEHAAKGERVRLVDMHAALAPADFSDALHPNDAGYAKMAKTWFDALMMP
jgi:lysophospholipase L1-like esterase